MKTWLSFKGGLHYEDRRWWSKSAIGAPIYSRRKKGSNLLALILTTVVLLMFSLFVLSVVFASPVLPAFVYTAQAEIGHGEFLLDNHGPDIKRYLRGEEGKAWCAGFVSYCLSKTGYKGRYLLRARDYLKVGKVVKNPQPGDLIVFWRGNPSGRLGHVGIVEAVSKDTITTIEGNTGEFPSKVKKIVYQKNNIKRLLGFVRIAREQAK